MRKAYEVMTQPVATCEPETSVASVATIMRDRDIGSVLIVENEKLQGIVTDRDLALQALTGDEDLRQTPIRKFMNSKVVTGEAAWGLDQIAKVMAEHQIRRLPIVQKGQLVGLVSLGDVSRYVDRKDVVTDSLQAVSTPSSIIAAQRSGGAGVLLGLALVAVMATLAAYLTRTQSGQTLRKQMARSELSKATQHTLNTARDKVDEAASSPAMRDLRRQMRSNLNDFSTQVQTRVNKPAKRKFMWAR